MALVLGVVADSDMVSAGLIVAVSECSWTEELGVCMKHTIQVQLKTGEKTVGLHRASRFRTTRFDVVHYTHYTHTRITRAAGGSQGHPRAVRAWVVDSGLAVWQNPGNFWLRRWEKSWGAKAASLRFRERSHVSTFFMQCSPLKHSNPSECYISARNSSRDHHGMSYLHYFHQLVPMLTYIQRRISSRP